ncbi:hypothetical protein [Microvirga aerophila]|uniref:Uncharacterized protein n=1 Tax=Microvirga aerophila TaxID=670291 RepID=A0A512C412_9HYPH|nr:hypothetical protein [Microvirga aerophila]GEO18942.1 hypothetical protein MAE02_66380 [Microvirga aerophila]
MLQYLHSILIGVTEERNAEERSSPLAYGFSLAREAGAHVTVQAASLKLVLTHAFISSIAEGLVAAENSRLDVLANAVAYSSRQAATAPGLACASQAPQLTYPNLIGSFTALRERTT